MVVLVSDTTCLGVLGGLAPPDSPFYMGGGGAVAPRPQPNMSACIPPVIHVARRCLLEAIGHDWTSVDISFLDHVASRFLFFFVN